MTSFKRWFGAGAIVLVALALVACPALVPDPVGKITPMTFTVGDSAQTVTDVDDLFTNTDDRSTFEAKSDKVGVATASISGTTLTVTPVAEGKATVTITATLSNGKTATTSFMVTVKAKPADPPDPVDTHNDGPRMFRDLPDLNDLKVDVTPDPIDLSMHFRDDEGDDIDYAAIPEVAGIVGTSVSSDDMLMITVMAPGTTAIHVTATDEHGLSVTESFDVTVINQAPMATDVNAQLSLSMVAPHNMSEVALARHFTDPERDPLTYSVASVDPAEGVLMATVPTGSSTLMLTAAGAGAADVTVRAEETGNTSNAATKVFRVVVTAVPNEAPMVTMEIPDQTLTLVVMDGMESATAELDLADYFEDTDGMPESLMYSDDSDMTMIDGSTLTITADAAASGMTSTITVTASDGADSISDMFDVMVMAPDAPTWKKEIPDVTFEHDGGPQMITLAKYFNDATGYALNDDIDESVVMAALNTEQTMLTLTREGAGETVVEITPSNSGGDGTTQSITVTVNAAPTSPKPPTLKPGKSIPATVKITVLTAATANDSGFDVTDDATLARLNSAEKLYMLRDLIKDPERADADLEFMTETKDPTIVGIYADPPDESNPADDNNAERAATTKATLDKKTSDAPNIRIRGRNAGTTNVMITASSDSGASETWTIEVTVATSNTRPSVAAGLAFPGTSETDANYGKFVGLDDANRLKLSDTKMWKEKLDLGLLFDDEDVETNARSTGDSWTFKAMSTNEKAVTVDLQSTNNSAKPDESYVILKRVGSGDAVIYFTVTDSFGMSPATPSAADLMVADPSRPNFAVKVNNAPVPMGEQAGDTKETLARLSEQYKSLGLTTGFTTVRNADGTDNGTAHQVTMAVAAGGFFSDKDTGETATLMCNFDLRGDDIFPDTDTVDYPSWENNANRRQLNLASAEDVDFEKQGTAYIDVWCTDAHGEASSKATLTIAVTSQGSIH